MGIIFSHLCIPKVFIRLYCCAGRSGAVLLVYVPKTFFLMAWLDSYFFMISLEVCHLDAFLLKYIYMSLIYVEWKSHGLEEYVSHSHVNP